MRILITGATSMIGIALCEKLILAKHEVVAIIRKASKKKLEVLQSDFLKIIECDMDKYHELSVLLSEEIDSAILLAWNGTRGSDRENKILQEKNYQANMELLMQLKIKGCKRVLIAGSQAEYGPIYSVKRISEQDVAMPNTQYGIYKLKFYEDSAIYCQINEMTLLETRIFSLYGPNDLPGTLIMSMLDKMLSNEDCNLTKCMQLWDFLYIDDAVDAICCVLFNGTDGIYNVGYGEKEPRQLKSYVEEMRRVACSESKLVYGAIPYSEDRIANLNPSVEKIKSLGWSPKVSFEEGIKEIINKKDINLF